MKAKEFKKGFNESEKRGDVMNLVDKLTPEEARKLYEATKYVNEWTGIDMRQEFFQPYLKRRAKKKAIKR